MDLKHSSFKISLEIGSYKYKLCFVFGWPERN